MPEIIIGPPVTGEDFYDRDELIEETWMQLKHGSVLLVAPRRFGKTSIMLKLRDTSQSDSHLIFLDVEWFESPAQFVVEIIAEMIRVLPTFRQLLRGVKGFPKDLIHFLQETISNVGVAEFKIGLRELIGETWHEQGRNLLKLSAQLKGNVLLVVDELPLMIKRMLKASKPEVVERFLYWLRSLRQGPEAITNLRFVLGGSIGIEHVLRQAGADASMNDLIVVKVSPFSTETASSLVHELFGSQNIDASGDVIQRVLDEVQVFVPFFLQLLVSLSIKLAREKREPVNPELVSEAYNQRLISVESRTYFESFYTRLKAYYEPEEERIAKAILRDVARAGEMTTQNIRKIHSRIATDSSHEDLSLLLNDLENDFYLEHQDKMYRFHTKVLRDWWLRFYGLE